MKLFKTGIRENWLEIVTIPLKAVTLNMFSEWIFRDIVAIFKIHVFKVCKVCIECKHIDDSISNFWFKTQDQNP